MPFIVSTGTKKPDPELRKLIRSHVMKGKNRGRILRPKYKIIADSGSIVDPKDTIPSSDDVSTDNSPVSARLVTIPRKVGSDISLTRFADTIEDSTASVIIQCKQPHASPEISQVTGSPLFSWVPRYLVIG